MGFHPLDLLVILGVALLIFGPKTLQSLSHNVGRGLGHAKEAKDKIMAELPVEELSHVTRTVSQIPLTPQQAAHKLVTSALLPAEAGSPAQEQAESAPESSSQA